MPKSYILVDSLEGFMGTIFPEFFHVDNIIKLWTVVCSHNDNQNKETNKEAQNKPSVEIAK